MRVKTLERRRRRLVEHLGESNRNLRQATSRGHDQIDRYTRALMERSVQSTEADIAWLDELIAAERHSFEPKRAI